MERRAVWGCLSQPSQLEEAGQCAVTAFRTRAALQAPPEPGERACLLFAATQPVGPCGRTLRKLGPCSLSVETLEALNG